jgi:hypothetical protein
MEGARRAEAGSIVNKISPASRSGSGCDQLVNISQVKRVLLDEMTPDLRLRFLEILDKMVHGHLSVEAMQRVEPACDTAMKMLDEMKPLSIDDKCRLMMRWNVMATFCNLNPSIVEAIKLFSFGEPTYQRRDERVVRIGVASTVPAYL